MKWSIKLLLLIIGALLCRAEVDGGSTSDQDVTAEDEESKVTPDQDLGTTRKEIPSKEPPSVQKSPMLPNLPFSPNETLAHVFPGVPLPPSDDDYDGMPGDEVLPFGETNLEDGQKVLEDKCRELGGEEAVSKATAAKDKMMECAQSMVNVTELQGEIDANKATGELDTVFKKYCRKVPRFKECLTDFTEAVDPCLKEEEKVTKQFLHNVTDAMLSFICYKEGDRIALFIAEGGPECLEEKQNEVKNCLNSTVAKHLPKTMPNAESLPLLVLEEAQCLEINELQACLVKSLETCREPTPANIVESMINYLKRSSPCAQYLVESGSGNIVNPLAQTLLSSFIVFVLLVFQ